MKVLFITRKYPPSIGGMELFSKDLAEALSEQVDVELVKWGGGRIASVLALPYLWTLGFFKLSKGGIDIIHANDGITGVMAYSLSKLFRKPLVVLVNGLDLTWDKWFYQAVTPKIVARAQAVFCISKQTMQEAVDRGIDPAKVHFIPPGINDDIYGKFTKGEALQRLGLAKDSQVLLSVGRLVKRKGINWFISYVLPELVKRYPKLVLLVVGDGSDRQNIEESIKRQALGDYIKLLGRVDEATRIAAYNAADIFIMPNISVPGDMEGFGLVTVEASAAGLPVIAAQLEGIKDAVKDNQNGILVRSGDAEDYIKEISKLLSEPKLIKSFGIKARDYTLKNYNWSELAKSYVRVYKDLL